MSLFHVGFLVIRGSDVQDQIKIKGYLIAGMTGSLVVPTATAAQPVTTPSFSWTGFYVGAHVGFAQQDLKQDTSLADPYSLPVTNALSSSRSSFMGGAQAGYNWQSGRIVFGYEADISGLSGGGSSALVNEPYFGGQGSVTSKIGWLSTIRGRVGYILDPHIFGATMIYATGGAAIAGIKNSIALSGFTSTIPRPPAVSSSESTVKSGWTLGGGFEHRFAQHWSVRAEGLYVDLGDATPQSVAATNRFSKTTRFSSTFKTKAAIGRVGVNYHF